MLTLLAISVLLLERLSFIRGKVKCCNEVGHLPSAVGHLSKYLVGHFKVGQVKKNYVGAFLWCILSIFVLSSIFPYFKSCVGPGPASSEGERPPSNPAIQI